MHAEIRLRASASWGDLATPDHVDAQPELRDSEEALDACSSAGSRPHSAQTVAADGSASRHSSSGFSDSSSSSARYSPFQSRARVEWASDSESG